MHSFDSHRARVLAPDTIAEHAASLQASSSPQLSRQAALFEKYRDLAAAHEQAAADAAQDALHNADGAADMQAQAAWHEHTAPHIAPHPAPARHRTRTSEHDSDGDNGQAAPWSPLPCDVALPADIPERDEQQSGSDDSGEHDEHRGGSESESGSGSRSEANAGPSTAHISAESRFAPPSGATSMHPAALRASAVTSVEAMTPVTMTPANDKPHSFVDYVVSQAAEFCSNPAVLARGSWQLTIPLDPQQLPECNLHLSLSYFDLTLRFETERAESRQLISFHAARLREQLGQLLKHAAPATPRNIEITVS